jgi:hypothetical protein
MTVRNTPGDSYSASADLELIESHLAKILFTLGLDWADIDATTIDDILNKINENYWLDPNGGAESGQGRAPNDYLKINNGLLATLARRNWYWRQLAVGVS